MGGFFEGDEAAPPRVMPGFEFMPKMLENFGNVLGPQLGRMDFSQLPQIDLSTPQGATMMGLLASLSNLGMTGPSQQSFAEGLQTGYTPDMVSALESRMLPALERSFSRGSEAIRSQAADLGTFSSTGTRRDIADYRGGLEGGLLQNIGNFVGQGALQGQNIRAALSQYGMGIPSQVLGGGLAAQQQALQNAYQQYLLPLQALAGLSQGASATPYYQPVQGPSKFESLLGAAAPVAGAMVGNPGLFAGGGQPATGSTGGMLLPPGMFGF